MKSHPSFYGRFWEVTKICSLFVLGLGSCIPQSVSAQVIISEIMYDAPGADTKAEWIEVQNIGTSTVDIAKWKINDGSNHVFNAPPKNGSKGSLSIEPGGFLILTGNAEVFSEKFSNVTISIIDTVLNLSNDSGSLSLLDASGATIDKAKYSSSKGAAGTGESLQKIDGKFIASLPTPGATNVKQSVAKKMETKSEAVAPPPKQKSVASRPSGKASKATAAAAAYKATTTIPESQSFDSLTKAEIPTKSEDGGIRASSWTFGALALSVVASAAAMVARKKRAGEWDIEDISDDA